MTPERGEEYRGYAYSYPHKSAYRELTPARAVGEVWAGEAKDALFLYLHLPFCEMRCGFCNLFTRPVPPAEAVAAYLATLARQVRAVAGELGEAGFARMAVGGGTPTLLEAGRLRELFGLARELGADPARIPCSVETSPGTATAERLEVLRELGVERVSIGVQTFEPRELVALGRPEPAGLAREALGRLAGAGFPVLNVDMIYGIPGQDEASFEGSLREALGYGPREVYLYPLYVRPLTGMGRRGAEADPRRRLYERGRAVLAEAGFEQVSMRFFRRPGTAGAGDGGYCCQDDGMLGLGCGARSYTRRLHYSSDYAVGQKAVKGILERWVGLEDAALAAVDYGVELRPEEERRRYVIKSLLRREGLDLRGYSARFGSEAGEDLPELGRLVGWELAREGDGRVVLTAEGMARSDAIGPWLYSEAVQAAMEGFELR